jgi:hypothetical protein
MKRVICAGVLLIACSGKKEQKPPPAAANDGGGAVAVTAKDASTATVTGDAGVAAQRKPVLPRAQVDALLAKWLEAQNGGDFAAYSALYDDPFQGIRRSGKQKVELDRKGWLADRKKMFAKPMLVGARDVEVVLAPAKAVIRFTQEWSSGKYHDVGPKVIEVEDRAGTLKISREEMLASKLVKPTTTPAGGPALYPTIGKTTVVLTGEVEARWAKGAPTLHSGSLPERDPSCDEDPPDYEQDQGRYWECAASDPRTGSALFQASQSVDKKALPPELAAWIGKKVRLGGGKAPCEGTVERLELWAERETTFEQVTGKGTDDDDIAEAVMETGEPVLTAVLTSGCVADWAQPVDAAPPVAWTVEKAPPPIAKAVLTIVAAGGGSDTAEVRVLRSPDGKTELALASVEEDYCEPVGYHALFRLEKGAVAPEPILDDSDPGRFDSALDADGDGWPELVFDDGVASYDKETEGYQRVRMVRFPDEIANCGD